MKSSFNILFIFTLICLSFIVAAQSRQGHHKHKKVGGWNEVPLESPHVYEKGLQFLLNEKKQLIEGYSLERVEAQVVAGFNYRFTFKNK